MKAPHKPFALPKGFRARAEHLLRKTSREITQMPTDDVQKLVHELQVHQIELEMQNDELHRSQLELEKARDRYADLYDFAPSAHLTLSANGEILEANIAARGLLGGEGGRLIGQKFTRFVAAEAQDNFYLLRREVFKSDARRSAELELVNAKAGRLSVLMEAVRSSASSRSQFRVSLTDFTERKRVEEALLRSEYYLSNFFNQAPIGLLWLSPGGVILRANQTQLDLLGYSSDEYLCHFFSESCVEPENARELLARLTARETIHNFSMALRRKDGAIRHTLVDAVSFQSKEEHGRYFSIFLRDITVRINLERELQQVSEQEQRRIAQDLHDGLGQLLAGTAYMTDTLQKDLAAKFRPEARRAKRISKLLDEAISQTRKLARGLHPVGLEANGLMAALKALAARTKNLLLVECRFTCRRPVLIRNNAIATHLFRIAQEAITNAIKHAKPGRIEISLTKTPERINLAVRDDGAGFPDRRRKKHGMGLHIMRYRARIIGGTMAIQKEAGGGTTVVCTVHLPAREEPANVISEKY
jgi:PAS domain S-box-containing protein